MRIARGAILGAFLLIGGTACSKSLTGPSLGANDPNGVKGLTDPGPIYAAVVAGQALNYTSQVTRLAAEYSQQVAGIGRQQQGFDLYNVGPSATDVVFAGFYAALASSGAGGGGAADARKIQLIAQSTHDSIYKGIGMVWEAMIIGDAASIFGAVPYSQAFQPDKYPTPTYDPQLTVFTEVEATLDSALLYLNCTPSTLNLGPTGTLPKGIHRNAEVIYGGRTPAQLQAVYSAVAHTLKARFFLMQSAVDPSNYAKALAEAQLGIASPADDFNWYADAASAPNQWNSFQGARGGDLGPAAALINLMRARVNAGLDVDNGRIGFYFVDSNGDPCTLGVGPADNGCTGYRQGGNTVLPGGGGASDFNLFNNAGSFWQPGVTYAETQLIIAEAALQSGAGVGIANTALNNVRANEVYGADPLGESITGYTCTGTCTLAPQPGLSLVQTTLQNIMEEKYIDLFATFAPYNDYKRTCLPWLAAAPSSTSSAVTRAAVPGRIPYGQTAINADPNTPTVGATANNADQPAVCPTLTYSSVPAAW